MKYSKQEISDALASIKTHVKKGDTVYTVLRHCSASGMMREITLLVLKGGEPYYLSYSAARVLGMPLGKRDGIKVGGCGMDMGFHVVYELSARLFGDGYALKQRWL